MTPTALEIAQLQKLLQQTLGPGIDYADIFLQYAQHESWALEEKIVKKANFTLDQGVGIRALSGETSGLAFVDDLEFSSIKEAANYAKKIAKAGVTASSKILKPAKSHQLYRPENPIESLSEKRKVELLQMADDFARQADSRVIQVSTTLTGSYNVILLLTSDGVKACDVRPIVHFGISVIVEENGKRERGNFSGGARLGYQYFIDNNLMQKYAAEAVRIALVNLVAIPAPAGKMPVVLGNGWPAVMIHEAVGHGLEADFNRKNFSVYAGKIGQKVASPLCTIIDQGDLPGNKRGSLNIDDEGTLTQKTVLIENGILAGYMCDKHNARLMGLSPTGNGRRASYANTPLPRMTNTYMLSGESDPEEIIASVHKGIYAVNFSGGQVDITSGQFVFSTSEAYLIEHGKISAPIKNATLIGNGPEVLNLITMVGNDLAFDSGIGLCGKDGQSVAVGVGQPTLKISELTVGGTS
ncbi:MAG: metalloprotease TldD [Gammaproteobacteria bacterium]|nr:metalloprotease TldD [Gammaproteobacteria bacterium]